MASVSCSNATRTSAAQSRRTEHVEGGKTPSIIVKGGKTPSITVKYIVFIGIKLPSKAANRHPSS